MTVMGTIMMGDNVMNNFGGWKVLSNSNYVYHNGRKYHPFLCIYDAAILHPNTNYSFTRDPRFSDHLFEYIISGKGYIDYDGKRYTVTAGDCILMRKDAEVSYFSDKDDPYSKIWFSADGEFVPNMLNALKAEGELFIVRRNLYDKFWRLLYILENDGFELDRISKHVLGIMLEMFTSENNSEISSEEHMTFAQQIKTYIDTVLHSAPSVNGISKHFGVCEATVIRRFKKEFGTTPNEYIKTQRLNMAESMLRNTNYSISQIATLMNYCSQNYFSGEFKEAFGMNPTRYREKCREHMK